MTARSMRNPLTGVGGVFDWSMLDEDNIRDIVNADEINANS